MNERDKELAKQAGFVEYELHDYTESGYDIRYTRFADRIRADEREACAVVAEKYEYSGGWLAAAKNIAAAIRARVNT